MESEGQMLGSCACFGKRVLAFNQLVGVGYTGKGVTGFILLHQKLDLAPKCIQGIYALPLVILWWWWWWRGVILKSLQC